MPTRQTVKTTTRGRHFRALGTFRAFRAFRAFRTFRWRLPALVTACFMAAAFSAGAGEPNLSLTITNETGNTVEHLFVRQAGNRLFGGDLLSVDGALDAGDSMSVGIASSFSESLYEVKAVGSDNTVYRLDSIRVGSGGDSSTAAIRPETATDSQAPDIASAQVFASTDTDVFYVYLERIDTQDLGANLAAGNIIPEDGSETIRYMASEADQLGSFILVDSIGASIRVDGPGD